MAVGLLYCVNQKQLRRSCSVVKVVMPVTVKTRIGWTDKEINILDFAKRMEDAGQMITVYARTRAQGYNGLAKWE